MCVNSITVKNREIPYINALIMSIMGSHELGEQNKSLNTKIPFGNRLLSYIKLNLLDAERDGILMTMMISGLKSFNCPFWNSTAYGNMPVPSGGGVQN